MKEFDYNIVNNPQIFQENRLPALIGALCALIMRFVMPDNMMLGGMGLLLVILMLSRCGVEAHTGGKCA